MFALKTKDLNKRFGQCFEMPVTELSRDFLHCELWKFRQYYDQLSTTAETTRNTAWVSSCINCLKKIFFFAFNVTFDIWR